MIETRQRRATHGGGHASLGKSGNFFKANAFNKKMLDLENEGQGHRVQHLQWSHSMPNTLLPIGWDIPMFVFFGYTSQNTLEKFDLENLGQGH